MRPHPISRRLALVLLGLVTLLPLSGCQTPSTLPRTGYTEAMSALAPGDVLKLTFPSAPELSQSVRIRADGKVGLPLVGEIVAVGKTSTTLQAEVSRLYRQQLRDSEVYLSVQNSLTAVYVSGAVNHPGKVALERPMTALEAIMEAGGPSGLANMSKVIVIRKNGNEHVTQMLNLGPALHGKETEVFTLRPFDIVQVPERFF